MMKFVGAAILLLAGAVSCGSAEAAPVDFRGGLVITNVDPSTCLDLFNSGRLRAFSARFRPAGLGDNGTDTKLSFFNYNYGFNVRKAGGSFLLRTAEVVYGESIGAGASAPYRPILKITQMIPAPDQITDTTPQVTIQGNISRFSGFVGGYDQCSISFQAVLFNP